MVRIILCFLSIILMAPAFAGPFEDALRMNEKVLLYMSSPTCGYCKKFDPIYEKLQNSFGNKCKFVKVDVSTAYGQALAPQVGAKYVPFVVLLNSKHQTMTAAEPACLMDYACMSKEITSFIK